MGEIYNSEGLTHAASIAYYALLSLFPIFLLALAILGEVTSDPAERDAVVRFVFRYFPRQFDFITGQLDAFKTQPVSFGVGGIIALVWASLGVFNAVTSAVNHAWGVERRRSFLRHRLISFLMLLSAGGVLLLGLILASMVKLAETRLGETFAPIGDAGLGVGRHRALCGDGAADCLRGAGVLLRPQHPGPLPRSLARRRRRRPVVARRRCRCSRGMRATWRVGTSSTDRSRRS